MSNMPKTVQEAVSAVSPTYVGGGTDLMPLLKNHVRNDRNLVFLKKIPQLKEIRDEGTHLSIGAGVTLWDVSQDPEILRLLPAVAQAAAATASPQIRNIATIGGNIMQDRRCIYFNQSLYWRSALPLCFKTGGNVCHQIPNSPVCRAIYYSDVATALLAYDADVEYMEDGEVRTCPLRSLIDRHTTANGLACDRHLPVLVLRFRVAKPADTERSGFHKYAMRATIDFPLINFALRCGGDRPAKLVAGAVSTQPVELPETAALLDSGASDEEVTAACKAELKKLAKPIKEACISPAVKRELYDQIRFLLHLRKPQ